MTGQKEEKEEKEKEEKEEKNVGKKFLLVGTQTGGPIKRNTRGPRKHVLSDSVKLQEILPDWLLYARSNKFYSLTHSS